MNHQELVTQAKLHCLNKYYNEEDIEEDLIRVKHVKKLIGRLKNGYINERLILNHILILFNVFHPSFVIYVMKSSFKMNDWFIVNTFLVFLRRSLDIVSVDKELLEYLKRKV